MNTLHSFFAWLLLFGIALAPCQAQHRYVEEIFPEVRVETDVIYGINLTSLFGSLTTENLLCDIYAPAGDSQTDRPVVLVAHSGDFLPAIYNLRTTGEKRDSAVVEICSRLARRGFVAIAFTYRLGWNPNSYGWIVRKSFVEALYRGIQDFRSLVRFVRKSAEEQGNPYGIDVDRIAAWGLGTGGYVVAGAAALDDPKELLLDKFLDDDQNPMVDTLVLGNIYGTSTAPQCLPNHPGHSSDFDLAIIMGGALADLEWLEGQNKIPPITGVHCIKEANTPYHIGYRILPHPPILVIDDLAGTRSLVGEANRSGINNTFNFLSPNQDPLRIKINEQKASKLQTLTGEIDLGTDNFYAFIRPPVEEAPWDWWNDAVIRNKVDSINNIWQVPLINADDVLSVSYSYNMDMSPIKARRYIDTVFQLVTPRICVALDLGCELGTNVTELTPDQTGLTVGPIPARDLIEIRTNGNHPMQSILVYDLNGRLVQGHTDVDTEYFRMDPSPLAPGNYILRIQFENGFANARIVIQ